MRNLTEGNIYKTFLLFSFPIIVTGFLLQLFSAVDTVIAGKILGEDSIAAIGATSSLVTLISCATGGYAIGFSIYIAKLFGAKQFEKIKQSFFSVLIVTGCFISAVIAVLIVFNGTVMDILKVEPEIRREAAEYFMIYCISLVFMVFRNIFTYFLHAIGNTVFPLWVSLISSVFHIGGSLLFVTVIKGPFGSVRGLALASALSVAIACGLLFLKIRRYFKIMDTAQPFSFDWRGCVLTFRYSLPTMLQQIIMYTSDVMISPLINSLGVVQLSAYSVSHKLRVISEQTFCSSSKALSNYAAQCIGAGKTEKIKKGIGASALQGMLMLLPIIVSGLLFSKSIAGLFFSEAAASSGFSYAVMYLQHYMPFMFFNVINNLFHSFFRGIKAMGHLLLITAVGSVSKYVLTLLLLEKYQIHGIWLAIVLAWISEAVLCAVLYFTGSWKKYINLTKQ